MPMFWSHKKLLACCLQNWIYRCHLTKYIQFKRYLCCCKNIGSKVIGDVLQVQGVNPFVKSVIKPKMKFIWFPNSFFEFAQNVAIWSNLNTDIFFMNILTTNIFLLCWLKKLFCGTAFYFTVFNLNIVFVHVKSIALNSFHYLYLLTYSNQTLQTRNLAVMKLPFFQKNVFN